MNASIPPPAPSGPSAQSLTAPKCSSAAPPPPDPTATLGNQPPFTQDQFSIATAIAKSCPPDRTIDEYIQDLSVHIRRTQAPSAPGRLVLDSTEYWKDQCETHLRQKRALENELLLLKKHHQYCQSSRNSDPESSQESEEVPETSEASGRNPRKRRFVADEDECEKYPFLKVTEVRYVYPVADSITKRAGGYVLKLRENRESLGVLSKAATTLPEIERVAKFATQAISDLSSILSDCFLAVPYLKTNDRNKRMPDMLKRISDLVILNLMSVFEALTVVSRTMEGRKRNGRLLHSMDTFFKKSMDLLHTLGSMQLEHEEAIENCNLRRKKVQVEETEYVANMQLGRILSIVVYNFEWDQTQSAHSQLLEGVLYVVLEHVGRILSTTIFGEHIAASKNPGKITERDGDTASDMISKHEMRYAIQILHSALGRNDKKDLFLHVLAARKENLPTQPGMRGGTISVPPGDLLKKAKVLLQSTLMKTTLGYDELEILRSPPFEEYVPDSVVDGVEHIEYGPMWFVEQMWWMLGWDLVV